METPPALRKFNAPGTAKGYPAEEQVAAILRSDLGIDDAGLKAALSAHLTSRLNELDAAIVRVGDTLFGTLPQIASSGPWRQAVVHLAQWTDEKLPESFDELLATRVEYQEADLAHATGNDWRMADPYVDGVYQWWHLSAPSPELVDSVTGGWIPKRGAALDVGCGCGLGTELAHLAVSGWQAVGVDLSEPALGRAGRCTLKCPSSGPTL